MFGKLHSIGLGITLFVISLSVLMIPYIARGQSGVTTGSVTSSEAFIQVKSDFMAQLDPGQEGAFAFCVCSGSRGRIVYAHSVGADSGQATSDACREAAADCGGCYKDPVVRDLRPTPADTVRKTLPVWMVP